MSEINVDRAYLRTEEVAMLGESVPDWFAADTAVRRGAMAMLPFLMKRMNDDEWVAALAESKDFNKRLGGM